MKQSNLEAHLALQIRAAGLPEPERNYRFCAEAVGGTGRGVRARLAAAGLQDFQLDFAWPGSEVLTGRDGRTFDLAVEVDGLRADGKSAHQTISGTLRDRKKWRQGLYLGWVILSLTGREIKTGEGIALIERMMGSPPG